jgi:hypothetical protein
MSPTLICIVMVGASTLASGILATVWAKKREPIGYLISTLVLWVTLSTLPPFTPSWKHFRYPVDFPHFAATMIAIAPFAVLPLIVLARMVMKGTSRTTILSAALLASVAALPMSVVTGIDASCSLGDCL